MRILNSMTVRLTAVTLLFGAAGGAHGQRGSANNGIGNSQQNGGQMGQMPASQTTAPSLPPIGGTSIDDATAGMRNPRTEEELEKMRNNERQKKLIADTDKLLVLANELKVDMDKTSKDQLSLDVIHKADEIEKLAHSVKEKMKGS
jgi:hypothetical protein